MMNQDFSSRNFLPLALAFALVACGGDEPPTEEQLRPVRYQMVDPDNGTRSRSFSGVSKSSTESRTSFKVAGTVTNVPVQIGQSLKAGDVIAELDRATFDLQAQQAQASLVEAQANNRRAAANYERTKGLYANDNASLNDLESARAEAESAEAMVEAAEKALEIARLNASYTRLTADTDCSIASLDVEVNENVGAGEQVAVVSCGDEFEVTMDLPESLIGNIEVGTDATIRFGAIPGDIFTGSVSEVAVASAAGTAGFPVVIRILDSSPNLRSGLAADVTFVIDESDGGGSFILPVSAVVKGTDGTFVFIADPTGNEEAVIRRQAVVLGELTQDGVEVTDGVQVGDRIVTAGITVIRDKQRVLLAADE
ncbi:MAG: efflux RND transporter periplasmic adaptor subunit [Woeseiaceae bacterium]